MKANGERHYLWRAVDHKGELLASFVSKTRDRKAALKFLKSASPWGGLTPSLPTGCAPLAGC